MDSELTSTSEAATELGVTRQRVDQMYRHNRLKGPSRLPRTPILLFRWSVAAEKRAREHRIPDARLPRSKQHSKPEPQEIDRTVVELVTRVDTVEHELKNTRASNLTLRSANLAMNGVFEDLRTALQEDDDAIELLAEALKCSRRANAALRRAEEKRASIIDQFHVPDFPPEP